MKRFDIAVIGGGIAGASIAAKLASNASVILLERESHCGMHATGRSAAYYAPSYGNQAVRQLTQMSDAYYRSSVYLKPRQAIFVGTDQQQNALRTMQQEQPNLNWLNASELQAMVPLLKAEKLFGGLLDSSGGDLDVDLILQDYLRAFKNTGGVIETGSEIVGLKRRETDWLVSTKTHSINADIIVNAAGAWVDQIADLAGLAPLGLQPMRRTACLVDGPAKEDLDWQRWPLVVDVDEQFYFKPDAGQLLLSPADETPIEACDAQPDEFDVAVAVDRIQQVTDLHVRNVRHKWAGLRTFAPDKTFVVGFDPRLSGFFWCAGQGGYGVQSAPGVADIASQLCLQETIPAHLEPLVSSVSPNRLL